MCNQLVLRRVCGTSWILVESVRPVDSQLSQCDQMVLRRECAFNWFSSECVRSVDSQASLWDQLVSRGVRQVGSQVSVRAVGSQARVRCATTWFSNVTMWFP